MIWLLCTEFWCIILWSGFWWSYGAFFPFSFVWAASGSGLSSSWAILSLFLSDVRVSSGSVGSDSAPNSQSRSRWHCLHLNAYCLLGVPLWWVLWPFSSFDCRWFVWWVYIVDLLVGIWPIWWVVCISTLDLIAGSWLLFCSRISAWWFLSRTLLPFLLLVWCPAHAASIQYSCFVERCRRYCSWLEDATLYWLWPWAMDWLS